VLDEQCTQLVVDANPPRGAGSVLFAADESVLQPAKECGCSDAELIGSFADWQQLTVGWLGGRLVPWNVAVTSQAADNDFGETLTCRRAPSLAVEDSSNPCIVIVTGEALDQRDRVVIGTDRGLGLRQRNGKFCQRAAKPAQCDSCTPLRPVDVKDHFFDETAQQLLAIAVCGGGRRPHPPEIRAQREQLLALFSSERARPLAFAQGKLGLGLGQLAKRLLPVALETARDQAVLGLDLAIAALGPLCLIARPLDLKPPLRKPRVVVGLEHLGRTQRGLHAGRGERCEQRADHGLLDPPAADAHAPLPRFSTRSLLGQ